MSLDFFVMGTGSTPMSTPTGTTIQSSVPTNPLLKTAAGAGTFNDATYKLVCYEIYNTPTNPTGAGNTSSVYGVSYSDGSTDTTLSAVVNRLYPNTDTGVLVDGAISADSQGYVDVDTIDPNLVFKLGDSIFDDAGALVGTVRNIVTISGGHRIYFDDGSGGATNNLVALADNENLRRTSTVDVHSDYLSNLSRTESYRLHVFDKQEVLGQELSAVNSGMSTNDYFVILHADDENLHHMAKITSVNSEESDTSIYSYLEFDPPMPTDVPKGTKFAIYKGPLKTRTDVVAVAYGLLHGTASFDTDDDGSDDITLQKHIEYCYVSSPKFYFYNDRVDNKNQLNNNTKYGIRRTINRHDGSTYNNTMYHDLSIFSTESEYGNFVSDTGRFNHHGLLVDNLRAADEPTFAVTGSGGTGGTGFASSGQPTQYRRYLDDNGGDGTPFGTTAGDYNQSFSAIINLWSNMFLNINRERSGKKGHFLTDGPLRYLHYDDSPIKNEKIPRVSDVKLSNSITSAGSYAEIEILDAHNIMAKKINANDPIELKQVVASGNISYLEMSRLFGTITSQSSGDTILVFDDLEEGQDLRTLLVSGSSFETIRINTNRYKISAVGAPSNGSQQVTISHYRESDESGFSSGGLRENLTSAKAFRRTWSKLTSTLMVDFPIDTEITYDSLPMSADIVIGTDTLSYNSTALTSFAESRINGLELTLAGDDSLSGQTIKIKYGDSKNQYVKIQDFDRDFSPTTGLTINGITQAYFPIDTLTNVAGSTTHQASVNLVDTNKKTGSILDYFAGAYIVEKVMFKGSVETIEEKIQFGMHKLMITGRSDVSKLLGPVLNKNYTFSEDWVYSTLGPYYEIQDTGTALTNDSDGEIFIGDTSFTVSDGSVLSTGDLVFTSSAGDYNFIGVVSNISSNTITLDDGSVAYSARNQTLYKSSINIYNSNHTNSVYFGKAIQSHPTLTNTPTSLKGASNKGFFFTSGKKLTFSSSSNLVTSKEGKLLANTSDDSDGRARGYYLDNVRDIGDTDVGFFANARNKAVNTINSLSHYNIVSIESGEGEAIIELAPNCPAILARVDRNVEDVRFETVTVTTTQIDAASDDDNSQTYFDGSTYSAGHRNEITVDTGSANTNIGEGNPIYKSDGTFVGIVYKIRARAGAQTPTEWDILLESKLPDGVSLAENEQLYVSTQHNHGLYFINTQGLNDGGILQAVNPVLGNSRKPLINGAVNYAEWTTSLIITVTGTNFRFGKPIYRYVDLQKSKKGGLYRAARDIRVGEKFIEYNGRDVGNIHAYASSYKSSQRINGRTSATNDVQMGAKLYPYDYDYYDTAYSNQKKIGSLETRGVGPVYGSNTISEPIRNETKQLLDKLPKLMTSSTMSYGSQYSNLGGPWGFEQVTAVTSTDSKTLSASSTSEYNPLEFWRHNPVTQGQTVLDKIDPKGISYHIFAASDLYPESMSRPNHLGFSARDLTDYNLVLHDSGARISSEVTHENYVGSISSHEMTDESFETVPITSSSITGNQIKRFGLMRLIDLTFDWHFNVVDPESPINESEITNRQRFDDADTLAVPNFLPLKTLNNLGLTNGNYAITGWDSTTVATVTKNGSAVTASQIDTDFNDSTNDRGWPYIYTDRGEFLGKVATDGSATSSADNKLTFSAAVEFPTGSDTQYTGNIFCLRFTDDADFTNNAAYWLPRLGGIGTADSILAHKEGNALTFNDITQTKGAIFSGKYVGDTNFALKNYDIEQNPTGTNAVFSKPDNSVTSTNSAYFPLSPTETDTLVDGAITAGAASSITVTGTYGNWSFSPRDKVYDNAGAQVGIVHNVGTANVVTPTNITLTGATEEDLANNENLKRGNDDTLALCMLPPIFRGTTTNNYMFISPDSAPAGTQANYAQGDVVHSSKILYYLSQGRNIYRGLKGVVLDRFTIDNADEEGGQLATGMTFPVSDALYSAIGTGVLKENRIYLKMSSKKLRSNSDGANEFPSAPYVQFAETTNVSNGISNPKIKRAYDKDFAAVTFNAEEKPTNVADGAKILFKPYLHLGQYAQSNLGVSITMLTQLTHKPSGLDTSSNTGSQAVIEIKEGDNSAMDDNHWLAFAPNLTGYYLVSTEGYYQGRTQGTINSADSTRRYPIGGTWTNAGTGANDSQYSFMASEEGLLPKHIMHVISHSVSQGADTREHVLIVDNVNTSTPYISNYYKVMKPSETCLWPDSPSSINLYTLSSSTTKRPFDDKMYASVPHIQLWNGANVSDKREVFGYKEAVQSMYVLVNMDSTSDDIHIVPRGVTSINSSPPTFNYFTTIFGDGGSGKRFESGKSYDVLLNDGDAQERKQMSVSKPPAGLMTACNINFGEKVSQKMAGIVSVGEIFTVKTPLPSKIRNPVKANIASTATIAMETEDIVEDIMKINNIDFTESTVEYPYFTGPEFTGIDVYKAIQFLTEFKDKRITITSEGIKIRPDNANLDYSGYGISEETSNIIDVSKEQSQYDFYNEVIVYGSGVKSIRRLGASIKEVGKKTFEEVDETIRTQEEADVKANKLLDFYAKNNFRITIKISMVGLEYLRVGDIISLDIPSRGIPADRYVVLEIRYDNLGIMELEIGAYNKGISERLAELMVKSKKTLAFLRASKFKSVNDTNNFFDTMKIKGVRLVATKTGVFSSPFTIGFNYTVNVATNSVGFNPSLGSVETSVILDEDLT